MVAVATELWFVQAFGPAAPDRAEALRALLVDAALIALDVAVGDIEADRLAHARGAIKGAVTNLLQCRPTSTSPSISASRHSVLERPSSSMITGQSPARACWLRIAAGITSSRSASRTLLSVLTQQPPDLLNALVPAEALRVSGRPLVTLRTAIRTRDLFLSKMTEDIDALARPLREMKLTVNRSDAASYSALLRLYAQRQDAATAVIAPSSRSTSTGVWSRASCARGDGPFCKSWGGAPAELLSSPRYVSNSLPNVTRC